MSNKTPFTDQQLYTMAVHEAYNISVRRKGEKFTDEVTKTDYTVVDVVHDEKTGLDAIALKDKNNNIMIVYGGTDTKAGLDDVITDGQIAGTYVGLSGNPEQFEQAKAFRNRVASTNPNASITLTGHSLGGGISNGVALASGDASINFNPAPLPYDLSTIYGNGVDRTDIINYQTLYDPLRIATAMYGGYLPGQLKVFQVEAGTATEEHNMVKVKFDEEGNLVDIAGERVFDFGNNNISTGDVNIDEAYRGFVMTLSGALTFIVGGISICLGLGLMLTPGTSLLGGAMISGGFGALAGGFLAFFAGIGRLSRSLMKFIFEKSRGLFDIIQNVNTMIQVVAEGFLAAGQQILASVRSVCDFFEGGINSIVGNSLKIPSNIISAVYENLEDMSHNLKNTNSFIQQSFQPTMKSFIECKSSLFQMTYSSMLQSIKTQFSSEDIKAVIPATTPELTEDIKTLNWDKIYHHVVDGIKLYKADIERDFYTSSRGFNHCLAEEIYNDMILISTHIHHFSEKIMNISTVFQTVESSISRQIKQIGG